MNALVLVDIQNDFLPNGNLPIVKGDEVISIANKVIHQFDIVVATQDYHPANHKSFASQHQGKKAGDVIELNGLTQVLWPEHCVQGTKGAHFAEGLLINDSVKIFTKGTDPEIDSYSGFFDNGRRKATGLGDY